MRKWNPGQALHIVFNWDLPSVEKIQNMVRVAHNLRAAGYEVIDGYGSELVVVPYTDLTDIQQQLADLDYLVAIADTSHTPHNGKYGFTIRLERIQFKDGEIGAKFTDLSTEEDALLRLFIKIGGEKGPGFSGAPARLVTFTDKLVEWEMYGNNVTGNPLIRRFDDTKGELVFRPLFWRLRQLVLEGHQAVAL
ncbi:MAG: hypothetical protein UZ21_OP11001000066 [Microgenomates bacterium OLB22]|nr:MAG: hypothetical protein UZ21_OP11001000066 [Microgenomates bacterium OLB22]